MRPKISVIMGVYNISSRYKKAIKSILVQTYSNFEFIICDDKSTDNTLDILEKISKKDKRIKIITNSKNHGLGFTLNHCLKYARGDYIARMDDDDISNPNRFKIQLNFLEANPKYAFVSNSYYIDDGSGEKMILKRLEETPSKYSFLWNSPFIHPSTMFRKSALEKVGGYRTTKYTLRAEDYDLYMRLYAAGFKGYNIQAPLYIYYIGKKENKIKFKFKYNWNAARVRYHGFDILNISKFKSFPYILKPLLIGCIPNNILYYLRIKKYKKHRTEN